MTGQNPAARRAALRDRRRRTAGGLKLLLVASLLAGCHGLPPSDSGSPPLRVGDTRTTLAALAVVSRPASDPSYRRAYFGPAWSDTDHNGCSQRRDALAAAVDRAKQVTEQRRGRCSHVVTAGTWTDPYTGQALMFTDLTDPAQAVRIPVDHVVALGLAYRYGANRWSPKERLTFATDLTNLQPTARTTNSSKSDHDAASWRPKRPYQCDYATRYIAVKAKYSLPVDDREKQALTEMLNNCR
jgi:hypothetical protein